MGWKVGACVRGLFSEIDIRRFWSKVDRRGPDECWPWQAGTDKEGYGRFAIKPDGKQIHLRAPRVVLFLQTGAWGEIAMHACDNPPCCNPAHLRWSTQLDNRRDAKAKGRTATIERKGHDWVGNARPRGERHPNAKLSTADVEEIRRLYKPRINGQELAKHYGVQLQVIVKIAHGQHRRDG